MQKFTSPPLKLGHLAAALSVAPSFIIKLRNAGMPVDSVHNVSLALGQSTPAGIPIERSRSKR